MTWVMIVLVYIGGFSDRESNGVTTVPGFYTQQECEEAAKVVREGLNPGKKEVRTVCVKQTARP